MMQVRMKSLGTDVTGPSPVALAEAPAGVPLRRSGLRGVAASRHVWVTTKQSCVAGSKLARLGVAGTGRGRQLSEYGRRRSRFCFTRPNLG